MLPSSSTSCAPWLANTALTQLTESLQVLSGMPNGWPAAAHLWQQSETPPRSRRPRAPGLAARRRVHPGHVQPDELVEVVDASARNLPRGLEAGRDRDPAALLPADIFGTEQ